MNTHEEKEKMMNELFSKRRSFSNIYNDSVDILKDTESELNKILLQNQKDLDELTKDFNYSDEDLKKLKADIEKDFNISIDTPETVVLGKASKEIFDNIYKAHKIKRVEATRMINCNSEARGRIRELLISNY